MRRRIESAFAGLNAGRIEAITGELAPDAVRYFVGSLALSGTRRTQVAVIWTETNNGTDGVRTSADGLNLIELRWGRVTSVRIYPDTAMLERTLARIAGRGTHEARAAPITS